MNLQIPAAVEAEIDALIGHYPQPRSAACMVLHALQDHFGFVSSEAMEWAAAKLGVPPIAIYELVTFYPMFRQEPVGRFHLKVCRTLSCALGGSHELYRYLCDQLGLDPRGQGRQTTADGQFTVEFVECLAQCDRAPMLMCNEEEHPGVTREAADQLLLRGREAGAGGSKGAGMAAEHGFEP